MEQKTTLSQSIDIVQQKAQYDEAGKKVLAEKIILAWIMKHTMKAILENEFQIPMTERMKAEVNHMCNLSDGVEQKGIEKGIVIGIEQGIEQGALKTLWALVQDNLLSSEDAAKRLDMNVKEFEEKVKRI